MRLAILPLFVEGVVDRNEVLQLGEVLEEDREIAPIVSGDENAGFSVVGKFNSRLRMWEEVDVLKKGELFEGLEVEDVLVGGGDESPPLKEVVFSPEKSKPDLEIL